MAVLGRKETLSRRPRVIDLNLLPGERGFKLSLQLLLVILAVALLAPLFLSYQWQAQTKEEIASLERQIEAKRQEYNLWRDNENQAASLLSEIQQIGSKLETISGDFQVFQQEKVTWFAVLEAIISFPGVSLSAITTQTGSPQIMVQGVSPDTATVAAYGIHLKNAADYAGSKLFSSVSSPNIVAQGGSYTFSFILQARSGN